ncbi:MAG: hypothetical protein U9P49_04290 [Thermodesulfobacteriota bacterium]|nr:hypothetical protein [Thermodesulfobacteriota bacterium]
MDLQAIAETTTTLYKHCRDDLVLKYGPNVTEETTLKIFERAHHHYLTNIINQAKQPKAGGGRQTQQQPRRQGGHQNVPKPKSGVYCSGCGRELTIGEKAFCDNNQSDYMCYQCSH